MAVSSENMIPILQKKLAVTYFALPPKEERDIFSLTTAIQIIYVSYLFYKNIRIIYTHLSSVFNEILCLINLLLSYFHIVFHYIVNLFLQYFGL